MKRAGLLEFRIVNKAGHLVPMDRPVEALDMVTSFVQRALNMWLSIINPLIQYLMIRWISKKDNSMSHHWNWNSKNLFSQSKLVLFRQIICLISVSKFFLKILNSLIILKPVHNFIMSSPAKLFSCV